MSLRDQDAFDCPNEILVAVLRFLSWQELAYVCTTCKRFRDAAQQGARVQLQQSCRSLARALQRHEGETWIQLLRFARLQEANTQPPFLPEHGNVALGDGMTALISTDGVVMTCGYNFSCKLGHSDGEDRRTPCPVPSLLSFKVGSVACGGFHTLFLTTCGKVFSAGANGSGQRGVGSTDEESRPTHLTKLSAGFVIEVVAGHCHSVALSLDGAVYTWGDGKRGQLGLGDVDRATSPTLCIAAGGEHPRIVTVAAGMNHTLCVHESGRVRAWGDNRHAQLGLPDKRLRQTPVEVPAVAHVVQARAGAFHSLLLTISGEILAMGLNKFGQLGSAIGSGVPGAHWVQWERRWGRAVQIDGGNFHTVAVSSRGRVYCWGANNSYQLGRQSATNRTNEPDPGEVQHLPADVRVLKVAAGALHSIMLTSKGEVWAWGKGDHGALGMDDVRVSPFPHRLPVGCAPDDKGACSKLLSQHIASCQSNNQTAVESVISADAA
ncbi:hypothetical protein CYMTET_47072 [Cymbomonas tetramitiformis]|uniref:F-box domain-containing protein n=1 Tax=Cymbomonas tetramitiformis TaxID=36881 RepID=A0AAE0EWC2_9CHLO|nr:hypothetical protein CYMTET_47072 [Cymbomonas tetramitiformis]